MKSIALTVNGRHAVIEADGADTLLSVLRDRLRLTGTKEGCSEGECGACTVLVDGIPVHSCIFAAHAAAGSQVHTVEGLADSNGDLSPIQQAFIDNFSVQCGFCTPGFLMTLTALIADDPSPTEDRIRNAVSANLCRCTGYSTIIDAVITATGRGDGS